jgi:hypothetical protein
MRLFLTIKIRMIQKNCLTLILSLVGFCSMAQQVILPLQSNPQLKNYIALHPDIDKSYGVKHRLAKTNAAFDSLPFFEDFTSSRIVPDTGKWLDHSVFINSGFAMNPPSYNVATFDGLDKEGNAYKLSSGIGYGPADSLTSVPLNFSGYSAANNVYFSFFYQRAGYGDAPQAGDSLLLQFFTFGGKWNTVWALPGTGLKETQFTQVLVPINNSIYFHGAFQFRFVNFANHTGNLNHWNVDYIRIDRNRSATDSLNTDVTIMTMPTPILKRYFSMPWDQYVANATAENASSASFYVRNLKNTNVQVPSKNFVFNKQFGNLLSNTTFTLGSLTFQSPQKITYNFATKIDTIAPFRDTVIVKNLYTASENSDVHRINDSAYQNQLFANYYAYDDGTAEAGYGIDFGSGQVALAFETNADDTLRAVDIYFNQSMLSNSGYSFSLTVWKNIAFAGQQNEIMHFQTVISPEHNYSYRDNMGGFTRFTLDTPRFIGKGKFYIGWRQATSFMLNIGFDMNYPDNFGAAFNPNMYYNTSGSWDVSGFPGTVMMRPVMGKDLTVVGIRDQKASVVPLRVYPNPTHALLYVDLDGGEHTVFSITNLKGQTVKQSELKGNVISIEDLSNGMYILNIFDPQFNRTHTTKFIIQ